MPAIEYLAELDSSTAQTMIFVLKPTLTVYTLLMIVRIVMTWSPELSGDDFPWSIAFKSTESVLDPTRKVIKPFNGLDVSPIVWVALLSFVSEILTGPQGILNLIVRKGI
jgi:YggT family protein